MYKKNRWIKSLSSFTVFCTCFFIMMVALFIFKNVYVIKILSILFILLFLFRLKCRFNSIRKLEYYKVGFNKQIDDVTNRGKQVGDVIAIMMYVLLLLCSEPLTNTRDNIACLTFYFIVYFAMTKFAIVKNNNFFRTVGILMTTIQGLLASLIVLVILLKTLSNFTESGNLLIDYSMITDTISTELFLTSGFFLETYPGISIIMICVTIILYIGIILITPVYQQENLFVSFKVVTLIVTLGGIIVFFITSNLTSSLIQHIKANFQDIDRYTFFYKGAPIEYIEYCRNLSMVNIKNIFYILLLPYTFGIIVANMVIDCVKKRNKKRINMAYDVLFKGKSYLPDSEKEYYIKMYHYYGGDSFQYDIFKRQKDMEERLLDLEC